MAASAAPAVQPWPRGVAVGILAIVLLVDLALWAYGIYEIFLAQLEPLELGTVHDHMERSSLALMAALTLLIGFGWAWRWAVAAGKIGGKPTARFGGA